MTASHACSSLAVCACLPSVSNRISFYCELYDTRYACTIRTANHAQVVDSSIWSHLIFHKLCMGGLKANWHVKETGKRKTWRTTTAIYLTYTFGLTNPWLRTRVRMINTHETRSAISCNQSSTHDPVREGGRESIIHLKYVWNFTNKVWARIQSDQTNLSFKQCNFYGGDWNSNELCVVCLRTHSSCSASPPIEHRMNIVFCCFDGHWHLWRRANRWRTKIIEIMAANRIKMRCARIIARFTITSNITNARNGNNVGKRLPRRSH